MIYIFLFVRMDFMDWRSVRESIHTGALIGCMGARLVDRKSVGWLTGRGVCVYVCNGVLVDRGLVAWYTGEVKEGSSKTINHLNLLLGLGVWNERSALPCQGYFSPHFPSLIHSSLLHSASSPNQLFFITSLFL